MRPWYEDPDRVRDFAQQLLYDGTLSEDQLLDYFADPQKWDKHWQKKDDVRVTPKIPYQATWLHERGISWDEAGQFIDDWVEWGIELFRRGMAEGKDIERQKWEIIHEG